MFIEFTLFYMLFLSCEYCIVVAQFGFYFKYLKIKNSCMVANLLKCFQLRSFWVMEIQSVECFGAIYTCYSSSIRYTEYLLENKI